LKKAQFAKMVLLKRNHFDKTIPSYSVYDVISHQNVL